MKNIFVVGYYGHSNVGDEQYKLSFEYIFQTYLPQYESYNIEYLDCDLINTKRFSNSDMIIVGGGDILNNYFLDKINKKFSGKPNKIIAVSVGMPYNEILINITKLGILDYIFIRTQQDFELFSQYYRADRIFYLPDISYYLLNLGEEKSDIIDTLDLVKKRHQKVIAFCLNRHIYTKQTQNDYVKIVSEFAIVIKQLINQGFYIVLLPFNTSQNIKKNENNMENDILIHNDVYSLMHKDKQSSILNIITPLTVKQTSKLFDYFYLTIPMRFHACLFSIYKHVPMIPVFTTKKIHNFLLDINWNHFYQLDTEVNDLPMTLDSQVLFTKINELFIDQLNPNINRNPNKSQITILNCINNFFTEIKVIENNTYLKNKNVLISANAKFQDQLKNEMQILINVIKTPYTKEITTECSNKTYIIIDKIINGLKNYMKLSKDADLNFHLEKSGIRKKNEISYQ